MALVLSVQVASAGAPPWPDAAFSYYAENARLATVLREFAGNFSLSLQLGDKISGTVNGKFNSANPTEFLNRLGGVYGFQWFTHAGTLYISRSSDVATRTINASGGSVQSMRQALVQLGVFDTRFGWGELPDQAVALVSGPPAYVSLIERTVAQLPQIAGGQKIEVFRLKHASASDRTIRYRDQQVVTPGLTSVLRNLIAGGNTSNNNNETLAAIAEPLRRNPPEILPSITGMAPMPNLSSGQSGSTSDAGGTLPLPGNGDVVTPTRTTQSPRRVSAASVQADTRLNAIIVQDIPERLPIYRRLIEQLDIPTPLIEIEATIIDIRKSHAKELGIAWGGRFGKAALGYGDLANRAASANDLSAVYSAGGSVVSPTTILTDVGNYISTRIRLLESQGNARVLARPSILTVDNVGALLDLSDTFYVKATGERVATVTPVTVGTALRVTPRYVESEDGPAIELIVDIEDGKIIRQETVDTLPIVRKSSISTQALVGENETLVIGGYNTSEDTDTVNKVPGLGDIPLLGALFSSKQKSKETLERLFLIHPKLISVPSGVAMKDTRARAARTSATAEITSESFDAPAETGQSVAREPASSFASQP